MDGIHGQDGGWTGSGRDSGPSGRDIADLSKKYPNISDKVWTAYKRISQKYHKALQRLAIEDDGWEADETHHPNP